MLVALVLVLGDFATAMDLTSQHALQTGRWTEEVPLALPPAAGAAVPELHVVLDHGVKDGPLGANWALQGLSKIERRGATGGEPAFDGSDTWWVDGQKLYWTSGPSQAGYRQEVDDNRLFYQHDAEGENHWTGHRDGWTWTFGEVSETTGTIGVCATESPTETWPCDTHAGEALAATDATTWHLSRVEDPAGNVIIYDYTGMAGLTTTPTDWLTGAQAAHLPETITYGAGTREVQFVWESRPDVTFAWRGGAPWVLAARLTAIETWVDGAGMELAGGLGFRWLDDDLTATSWADVACPGEPEPDPVQVVGSYLHRVLRLGSDGTSALQTRCLEVDVSPTTFSDAGSTTISGRANPFMHQDMLTDWDGDGRTERETLSYENDGHWQMLSCGVDVLCELTSAEIDNGQYGIADLDADGVDDVFTITELDTTVPPSDREFRRIRKINGSINDETVVWDGSGPSDRVVEASLIEGAVFADLNGDGLPDLITTTGYVLNAGVAPWYLEDDFVWPADWYTDRVSDFRAETPYLDHEAETRSWGDFNGDGLVDFVVFLEQADLGGYVEGLANESYSRVFYGDGSGGFHTSALCEADLSCAGTWYVDADLPDRSTFAALDLDGDGRNELLNDPLDDVRSDGGLTTGWSVGLTDLSGFSELEDANFCSDAGTTGRLLFQDVDADGFLDIVDRSQVTSDGEGSITTWLNDRTSARGRVLRVHGAWGGVTELSYAFSTEIGNNDALPVPVEVIRTVSDADGTSTFTFSGGTFEDRFRGFSDASVTFESGRTTWFKYGVSPGFEGAEIYRAEHRSDGTLVSVTYNHYIRGQGHAWMFDDEPPYWNPSLRSCTFTVGPGYVAGAGVAQTVTVEGLAAQCAELFIPTDFSSQNFGIVYGWDRHPEVAPGGGGLAGLAEVTWTPNGENDSMFPDTWAPDAARWNPANVPVMIWDYPVIEGDVPAEIAVPLQPSAPTITVAPGPTEVLTTMVAYRYDGDQRLDRVTNRRDVSLSADDLTTTTTFLPWSTTYAGKQTQVETVQDVVGATRTTTYGGFVGFGLPGWVTRAGSNTTGSASFTTSYTYDRGEVESVSNPDGSVDTYTINDCGNWDTHEDGVGRVESVQYDATCAETQRDWEGSRVVYVRDTFGRVTRKTTTPLVGGPSPDVVEERVYDDEIDDVDVRDGGAGVAWREPREGVRLTNGTDGIVTDDTIELVYLDPWGRPAMRVACGNAGGDTSAAGSTVLQAMSCDTSSANAWKWRAWAVDGTPRAEARAYANGDTDVPGTWTYHDSIGAEEQRLSPAPTESAGVWVLSTTLRTPGDLVQTDGMGTTCTQSGTTLTDARSCEGFARGSRTRDAWGQVITERNGEGEGYDTAYDGLGRATQRRLATTITTVSGAARPEWVRTFDSMDRVLTETDAQGNVTTWAYDSVGRLLSETYDPGALGGPTAVRSAWIYGDYAGTVASLYAVETDVNTNQTWSWRDGQGRVYARLLPGGETESKTWNAMGLVASDVDVDGVVTDYTYDALARPIAETVASGWTVEREYTAAGDLLTEVDPFGVETWTDYAWDGRVASVTRPHAAGVWTLASYTYRDDGQLDAATEGGVTTVYGYDTIGRVEEQCVGGDCGAALYETSWTYDAADRVVTETLDSDGGDPVTTGWTYNDAGWVTSTTDPAGRVRSNTYDVAGNLCRQVDEDGLLTQWTWDGWERPLSEDRPDQSPRYWSYTFATPGGEMLERTEPDGGIWATWYDHAGRPVQELTPDFTGVTRHFEGTRLVGVDHLDPGGFPVAFESYGYDALGRLTWSWGPAAGAWSATASPATGDWSFTYLYDDGAGTGETEVTRISPDGEQTRWLRRDGVVEQEAITDGSGADRVVHSYTYDTDYPTLLGRTTTDAAGSDAQTRTFVWEGGVRVVEVVDQVGTGPVQSRTASDWDAWGVPRALENLRDTVVESSYLRETDVLGRVTEVTAVHDGGSARTVTYGYSYAGRVTSVDTDFAGGYSYVRNTSTGLVDSVVSGANTYASIASRDALGRTTSIDLDGGGGLEFSWDTNGRILDWLGDDGGVTEERTWAYDDRGRPVTVIHTDGSGVWSEERTYDEPGWLLEEKRIVGGVVDDLKEYVHDSGGNRLETWENGTRTNLFTYDGSFLEAVDGSPVTWVRDGIVEDHRGITLERNPDGSERGVDVPLGNAFTILRDPWGQPVLTDDGTDVREQIWGNPGGAWPLGGIDENGDDFLYVAVDGVLVGVVTNGAYVAAGSDPSGNIAFVGTEWMGTPDAFGVAVAPATGTTARHLYAGLELLPGTPFQLARHRLYDGEAGRFTSMDPLGLAGGENRFSYADGDPTRFWDPAGLSADECGPQIGAVPSKERMPPASKRNPEYGSSWFSAAANFWSEGRRLGEQSQDDRDRKYWAERKSFHDNMNRAIAELLDAMATSAEKAAAVAADEQSLMELIEKGEAEELAMGEEVAQVAAVEKPAIEILICWGPCRSADYNTGFDYGNLPRAGKGGRGVSEQLSGAEAAAYFAAQAKAVAADARQRATVAANAVGTYYTGLTDDTVGGLKDPMGTLNKLTQGTPVNDLWHGRYQDALVGVVRGPGVLAAGALQGAYDVTQTVPNTVRNAFDLASGDQARANAAVGRQVATGMNAVGAVAGLGAGATQLNAMRSALRAGRASTAGVAGMEARGALSLVDDLPCPVRFNSFAAGTLVLALNGLTPIEDLHRGDLVWTQDEDGDAGFRRVLATVSHEEPFLVAVQWSGYPGGAIEATFEHPFYVEGKGWVAAAELAAGDLVVTAEGGWREVEGVEFGVGPAWVHNLTVEEKHTFFVGEEGAWVHNCPTASRGGPQKLYRIITETTPEGNLVSNAAKGLPPRGPEVKIPSLHTGLSMFDTLEGAAAKVPILERGGRTVYGIGEFTPGAGVSIEKTLGPGHYTVSGTVDDLSAAWAQSWTEW